MAKARISGGGEGPKPPDKVPAQPKRKKAAKKKAAKKKTAKKKAAKRK